MLRVINSDCCTKCCRINCLHCHPFACHPDYWP